MLPFRRIELNRKLWCEADADASTVAILTRRHFAGDGPVEVLSTEDDKSLTLSIPRRVRSSVLRDGVHHALDALTPQLVARIVIHETKTTQYYREYRLRGPITDGTSERGIRTAKFESLTLDLARCGAMREVANGLTNFTFDLTGRTVLEIVQFIADKAGLPWLTVDPLRVEPSYTFESFAFTRLTPLGGLQQLRAQLRDRDIPGEYDLEQDGTDGYVLAVRSQIGADIQLAPFTPKAGQLGVRRTIDPTQQATRVSGVGGADPDGESGIWGRGRFTVANKNAGANTFELVTPGGGAVPIAFSGEFALPTAWWMYRVKTGETWPIVSTSLGSSGEAIVEVANIYSLQDGERMEFRASEPSTNTRYHPWDAATPLERKAFEITAIDAGAKELTISLPWTNVDPVSVDGQYDGWRVRLSTKIAGPVTATTAHAANTYALASITGIQVDDWVLAAANTTAPYNADLANMPSGVIDSIDVPTKKLTVSSRYQTAVDPIGAGAAATPAGFRVYRELRNDRVRATTASSNKIKVDSVTGLSVGDVLELDQPDGAGELPTYVDHPIYAQTPPAGFGVQAAELPKPLLLGLQELGSNPFARATSGGTNDPADNWSHNGIGTITRNTNTDFIRFGDKSYLVDPATSVFPNTAIAAERFYPSWAPGRERVSARSWQYFTAWTDPGVSNGQVQLNIFEAAADGTKVGSKLNAETPFFVAPDCPVDTDHRVTIASWVTLMVNGVELAAHHAPYGLVAEVSVTPVSGGVQPHFYLDTIDKWGHSALPETPLEFGDAPRLLQASNAYLREWSYPMKIELAAINLTELGRRIDRAIGGLIPVVNRPYGVDETQRLLRAEITHFHPDRTQCVLARRDPLLTELV